MNMIKFLYLVISLQLQYQQQIPMVYHQCTLIIKYQQIHLFQPRLKLYYNFLSILKMPIFPSLLNCVFQLLLIFAFQLMFNQHHILLSILFLFVIRIIPLLYHHIYLHNYLIQLLLIILIIIIIVYLDIVNRLPF